MTRWLCVVLASGVWPAAQAQGYPSRPIRLVASTAVGSGSDVVSRLLAPRLTEVLGQQVIVDNRPGASGLMAAEVAARAAPDGYTLWMVTQTQLISTTLFDRFHLQKDYEPIGMLGGTPFVIVASNTLNVKSIAELIALAKAKPGFVMYGSSGTGTSGHLCLELFQALAGVKLVHVPYKGSMMALTEVMGGQMHVTCPAAPSVSLIAGGQKVRMLGVTTSVPTALAPGVPTVAEALPGYELNGWYGMLAPPGTPKALALRLNQAFTKIVNEPAMRDRLLSVGVEATPSPPEPFAAFLSKEHERWAKLLKEAGIKPTS
jgi:tripartite-type tricarboxylate transporter receptor subunit TctC